MGWLTRRASVLAMTTAMAICVLGVGVAQASDTGVLRGVALGAKATTTPAVESAALKLAGALRASSPSAVLGPSTVYIRAYSKAVRLIRPTHGASKAGKRLKTTALAAFSDNLRGAIALRRSAREYLAGNTAESHVLLHTFERDFAAGKRAFHAAATAIHKLIAHLEHGGHGGGSPITKLP